MQIHTPLPDGLSLVFAEAPSEGGPYATSRLQRGLLLLDGETPLAEEAVGFGVPVLKLGLQTLFPGEAEVDWRQDGSERYIEARFILNRAERLSRRTDGIVGTRLFYAVKDLLAASIRRMPASRSPLTAASSRLRQIFGWETAYTDAGIEVGVAVTYSIDTSTGKMRVQLDCRDLPANVTEVVLMHEQGAQAFDAYQDSSGLRLLRDQIGCWDEVRASDAGFESQLHKVTFKLSNTAGARLFRGRELIGTRLSWAGFGYSFDPARGSVQPRIDRHEAHLTRVLLIYPFFIGRRDRSAFRFPPLGVAYLAASLRAGGARCAFDRLHIHEQGIGAGTGTRGAGRGRRHLLHGQHRG